MHPIRALIRVPIRVPIFEVPEFFSTPCHLQTTLKTFVMQVLQKLSLRLYRRASKTDKDGCAPIYCKVTIDGMEDVLSSGIKVQLDDWDKDDKVVRPTHPEYKAHNKRLRQLVTDLERHFDLVVAKNGVALPGQVIESYQTPVNGAKMREEKQANAALSAEVDRVLPQVIQYFTLQERAENRRLGHNMEHIQKELEQLKTVLQQQLPALIKKANKLFDDKSWTKTFMLAMDESLIHFLQQVINGNGSYNTLKKKWNTKNRWSEFLNTRYNVSDMHFNLLESKILDAFVLNEQNIYQNQHNTIWKYVSVTKAVIARAILNKWIVVSPFVGYKFTYREPERKEWPTMEEMVKLIKHDFRGSHLEVVRDIFVYQSFAAPAYSELHRLSREQLITGIDGKLWADQDRRKTQSEETIPLLPICVEILEKYKNHPRCIRTGKMLPVPTGQYYNRCLKEIGEIVGIPCLKQSHQARYFFANEVAYEIVPDRQLIGKMMGQRDGKTINTYIKPKKKHIARGMDQIQKALYEGSGPLAPKEPDNSIVDGGAKVIQMPALNSGFSKLTT
ncbi:hypothetical protein EGT74_06340 [Chitinophaga lutea]|uniref:Phage integrase SAM-like domain-containing protein n=1 Tax=Chitinophaga lutea TaxID=2488634 RepID=A0A3N4PZ40_9BACT|nr:phage integrase SAM-like domain-containing protein [Chitinophaga lutea]RPE13146.1 hypothetical protein EGT74_06340 [Chitinophaga lutea]